MKTTKTKNWLMGNSEMAKVIRERDWSKHSLGPIDNWPQTLKTALGICLNSKFPMLVWWGKDLLVFYNDTYIPFVGIKHPNFVGKPAREQWTEIWESLQPLTEQVMTTGKATWAESMCLFMNRRGFLEETYFTFSYSPIIDENGDIVGIINPCQETTQRMLGERRLLSLQKLSVLEMPSIQDVGQKTTDLFAENNKDIPFALIYLTNVDSQTASLIGSYGIVEGSPISPAIIDLNSVTETIWPVKKLYNTKQAIKIEGLCKDNDTYFTKEPYKECPDNAYILPIFSNRKESLAGFLVLGISPRLTFDDIYKSYFELICKQISIHIANVHSLEDEKNRVEELSALNRVKTDFFNNVSHELRTPLTLILGPLEDLLSNSKPLAPYIKTELETVYRNAIRLLKMVNNILDFSKIESKRMDISLEPVDIYHLTKSIASTFMIAVKKAGLEFVVNCEPILTKVYIDKEMWENIIINLLSNAFKYTLQGKITLSLKEEGDHIVLHVTDTGVGIPKEELDKVFDRFHRVKHVHGRTHEGTGIGLALVKELVQLHGGFVNVKSELHQGSDFIVSIPMRTKFSPTNKVKDMLDKNEQRHVKAFIQEAQSLVKDVTQVAQIVNDKRYLVYIVEDNADMREYMSKLLNIDYKVLCFGNGNEALKAIAEHHPDLILSDVMMPVMDGLQLIRHIRGMHEIADIPIILVSARAGQESTITGIDSGADDYLVKPFSAKELLARVKQHVNMYHVRKDAAQMKDKFLASITHELRSPLTAIISYITLMHDGETGDISKEQKQDLGYVLTNAEHLLHLINELLELARIQAGKMEFNPEKINLRELSEEVKGSLKSLFQEKKINIGLILAGQETTVYLDRGRLKQVLYNYLSNAIKFTPVNGSVTLRFSVDNNQLQIEVEDSGIGIESDKIDQLFTEFQQIHVDDGQHRQGTGLGLSLTKRIVEAQGGKVGVRSKVGQGSVFSASLPLRR